MNGTQTASANEVKIRMENVVLEEGYRVLKDVSGQISEDKNRGMESAAEGEKA
jgi:hypothetical protein